MDEERPITLEIGDSILHLEPCLRIQRMIRLSRICIPVENLTLSTNYQAPTQTRKRKKNDCLEKKLKFNLAS